MHDFKELSPREIMLIEELGIARRLLEVHKLIETCLVVRQGGGVNLTHQELEYTRKNYLLSENIKVEDYTADIKMEARLR